MSGGGMGGNAQNGVGQYGRTSSSYPGYQVGGLPYGATTFNQNRPINGVNPYGGIPGSQDRFRALRPYLPPEDVSPIPPKGDPASLFGGGVPVQSLKTSQFSQQAPKPVDQYQQALSAMRGAGLMAQQSQPFMAPESSFGSANKAGAFSGAGSGAPYDPRTPGYQPGAGWQTMLRQYAMGAGQNPNQYIQDRGMNPMWGNQQQPWEPNAPPAGASLSEILRASRGY